MPETQTTERARQKAREGKAPSTQAGEFVREEMDHIREGKHGARNTKQAIAIGLSKARRAGVKLPPRPGAAKSSRRSGRSQTPSSRRSRSSLRALKREPQRAASHAALSRQSRSVARRRGPQARSQSARKAARTRSR